jgi:hypothetical protein
VSAELLHLVVAALSPDASDADRDRATSLAADLAAIDGVQACVVGRSETALTAAVWIDRRDRIEGFAAAPEHMRFVIEGVAQATNGMWSASIALDADDALPASDGVRALWAFALPAEPPAFEWEAQELLSAIGTLAGDKGDGVVAVFAGPTVEEREQFRAGGVVLATDGDAEALAERIEEARAAWGPLADRLQSTITTIVT